MSKSKPAQNALMTNDCRVTRRDFTTAVLASSLAATWGVGDSPSLAADKKRSMTLGFSSYGMKTLKTEQAIDVIAKTGYDAIELTVWTGWDASPELMNKASRREVKQRLSDRGLILTSLMEHVSPAPKEADHKKNLERFKRVYQLANDLSPQQKPVVQTVLGGGKWEDKKQLFVDRVARWSELGKQAGVVTCVKPHRGGGMSKPAEAIWLIKQLNDTPWVRMVYDYSHYIFRDIPLLESVEQSLPYTAHVAIKDTVNDKGKMRFVLPGEAGTIDFLTIFKKLHAGGYVGDISCEVSGMVWGKPGYKSTDAAQTCFKNISPLFKKAVG